MKRAALILIAMLVGGAFVVLAIGAGSGPSSPTYYAELDNAFGLVSGGDMKVAGVRAGKITDLMLCTTHESRCPRADRGTNRAIVGFKVTQDGFGSLRTDTFCQSRPQSLIGEYYLDCEPGSSRQVLKPGSTIPVTQTTSTISPDLIGDIMRQPYRQRFSIIIGELGAAAAGNGQNLNAAIYRAVPALRETDQVLGILGQQNRILADLVTQADTVLHGLANNRADVQRWITASRGAAADTAAQKASFQAGWAKLPGFLEALRPAMAQLGVVIDTNTPALQNLSASAGQLKTLFNNIGPFSTASTPSFAALGKASVTGDQAAKAATGTVQQLNAFAAGTPELAQNLSIILAHLDSQSSAVEHDPRAVAQHPTTHADTYTGLESLLQYVFDQASDTNYFTADGHLLGLGVFSLPNCDPYADAKAAQANPACHSWLGPTQPGVTTPDPTKKVATAASASTRSKAGTRTASAPAPQSSNSSAPTSGSGSGSSSGSGGSGSNSTSRSGGSGSTCVIGVCLPTTTTPQAPQTPSVPSAPSVGGTVGAATQQTQTTTTSSSSSSSGSLLGYLLGP